MFRFVSFGNQPRSQSQDGGRTATASFGGSVGVGVGAGSYGTLSTDVDVRQAGVVRATQDYLWSQTQGAGGGGGAGRGGARAATGAGPRSNYVSFPSQTQSKMLGGAGAYGEGGAGCPHAGEFFFPVWVGSRRWFFVRERFLNGWFV